MYFLMTTLKLIILLCCSSTVAISYGQTSKADTTLRLEEVVVTGSGTERPISQSPGSIHVVTPLLLRNSPAQSVDDILSMLSGVNTTRSDGISNMHTNVSIRGLAGDEQGRTLVLFDGIPINTSDEGSVNWNSIHIDNVQRIEVFKGPGSSLYGNSAMGGVINIISKRPVSLLAQRLGFLRESEYLENRSGPIQPDKRQVRHFFIRLLQQKRRLQQHPG